MSIVLFMYRYISLARNVRPFAGLLELQQEKQEEKKNHIFSGYIFEVTDV